MTSNKSQFAVVINCSEYNESIQKVIEEKINFNKKEVPVIKAPNRTKIATQIGKGGASL